MACRITFFVTLFFSFQVTAADYRLTPASEGHKWLMPATPSAPASNLLTPARAESGKTPCSQSHELRIGELRKRETLLFNGYADQVAHLYPGLDLENTYC